MSCARRTRRTAPCRSTALRDEGASFHYAPPGDELALDARRRAAGCVCVDMECASVAALVAFRQKEVFQFFYAGDNLDAEQWDARSLSAHAKLAEKDRIAELALEMARTMRKKDDGLCCVK